MSENLSTSLDLHRRLLEIASKAVQQVKENQRPNDAILPADLVTTAPDPPYTGR